MTPLSNALALPSIHNAQGHADATALWSLETATIFIGGILVKIPVPRDPSCWAMQLGVT